MSEQIHILELSTYDPPKIVEDKTKDWVYNGGYYDFLLEVYRNSPTHNTIMNNISKLIYGKGLTSGNSSRYPNDWAQFISIISKDDIQRICKDYYFFGTAKIQCLYNQKHTKIVQLKHIESNLVMPNKCNKTGDIDKYWFSDNWDDIKKYKPISIPSFGTSKEGLEILEIRAYSPGKKYFSDVEYAGCIPYAKLEEEISDYLINVVQHGFSGTKVINFNNGETDEDKMRAISEKTKRKFTGAKGDRLIISFNKNVENKTTIDDSPLDNAPEYYKTLSEECTHKILRGHKVVTPLLLGISADNGFASNADELRNGYILFENMVIKPIQQQLIEGFEKILNFNQNKISISFSSLQPLDSDGQLTSVTQTGVKMNSHSPEIDLSGIGESENDEWELVDSRKVDYEEEEDNDRLISEANVKLSFSLMNLIKTGNAYVRRNSEQDTELFRTRYRYSGEISDDSRPFCKAMLSANKLYRKEDIIAMQDMVVNQGWGPHGADTYSIWLYKGGGNCHHYWTRETYRRKGTDIASPLAKKISPSEARKEGEILPVNDKKVYERPVDMPKNGFLK